MVDERAEHLAGVREGQILAGKYRVERVLGVGGMGAVVAAHHVQLDTKVALKFLLPALLSNQEAIARFAREARSAVRIQSEHVARVLDVGTLENGAPYMVMEFLEGGDLSAWLQQRGPLPIEQAVEFVLQACVAVADAHGLGIIHRDLKPANLFCVRRSDGQFVIKVLDFGISKLTEMARASDPGSVSTTKTSALMGSPLYMSPEQGRSARDVDARADLWALGVILFELLAGTLPFQGETFGDLLIKIATQEPASLRSARPDVPPALEAVVLRCLAKDRQLRFPNVAELAVALLPFAPKRGKTYVERITGIIRTAKLSASALALPPSPLAQATLVTPASVSPWSGTMAGTRGRRAVLWGLAVTGVLGAAGGVTLFRRFPRPASLDGGPGLRLALGADAGESGLSDAVAAEVCAPNSTRCDGATPVSCKAGAWVDGTVVAGQCGAVCSPGSSLPRCSGSTPQTCAPTGQWQDGPACDTTSRCRDGGCVRPPPPSSPAPPKPSPAPSPVQTPTPNCDPPYTLDDQGLKHFKHECYSNSK